MHLQALWAGPFTNPSPDQPLLACNFVPRGAACKGAFQHFRGHSLPKSASNSLACNQCKAFLTISFEAKTVWARHASMMQSLSCAWFVFALGRFPQHQPGRLKEENLHQSHLLCAGAKQALLQELPLCMDSSSAIFSSFHALGARARGGAQRSDRQPRTSAVKSMEKIMPWPSTRTLTLWTWNTSALTGMEADREAGPSDLVKKQHPPPARIRTNQFMRTRLGT